MAVLEINSLSADEHRRLKTYVIDNFTAIQPSLIVEVGIRYHGARRGLWLIPAIVTGIYLFDRSAYGNGSLSGENAAPAGYILLAVGIFIFLVTLFRVWAEGRDYRRASAALESAPDIESDTADALCRLVAEYLPFHLLQFTMGDSSGVRLVKTDEVRDLEFKAILVGNSPDHEPLPAVYLKDAVAKLADLLRFRKRHSRLAYGLPSLVCLVGSVPLSLLTSSNDVPFPLSWFPTIAICVGLVLYWKHSQLSHDSVESAYRLIWEWLDLGVLKRVNAVI
jgi:hypothetical protein